MKMLLKPLSLPGWWLWSDHLQTARALGAPMRAMKHDFPNQEVDGAEGKTAALTSDQTLPCLNPSMAVT